MTQSLSFGAVDSLIVETRPVEEGAEVAILTLNDPQRRNTLRTETVERIVEAFDDFESERRQVGAVVITGAGRAFCAGADLGQLGEHGAAASSGREHGLRAIYDGFLRVARSPIPTIAAVNGAAVGAGMNLVLCCDVRLAARSARFDTRFLQLGLHPGGGHMWMLQRAVGPQTAAAMVLFSDVLGAEEALRHGLVYEVVDDSALPDRSFDLAARAASNPIELTRRAKAELMLPPAEHTQAVDREIRAQMWSMQQPFFADRLARLQRSISGRPTGRDEAPGGPREQGSGQ